MTTLSSATAVMPDAQERSSDRWLRLILLINLIVEILIVITGGLVRLTGSGLGCPSWPQCVPGSYIPVREQAEGFHKYIEFGNRTLTGLVGFVAIAAIIAIWRWSDRRRALLWPALGVLAGVGVQGVLGGITVRTGLNPATVAAHFLVSMVLVAAAAAAYVESGMPSGPRLANVPPLLRRLAWVTCALGGVVLLLGTIVTGSGPHSGDADEPARLSFDPRSASWLHADAVMLFVGLVVATWIAVRLTASADRPRSAWQAVLLVTLAQGAIGYVQYFTDLPEALVLAHMLGASLLVVALAAGMKSLRTPA